MQQTGTAVLRLLGIIIMSCCLWLSAVAQEEISITIDRIAGTVEVQDTSASGDWTAAKTKQKISVGWRLRTAAESKVQLVFPRDNVVILKENSILYVDNLDSGGGAKLGADEGSLLVDIRNALSPGSEFELQTPTALAVVRGTKYGVDDIDEYDVTFYGYGGQTEIFGIYGQGPVYLTVGNTVDVAYGSPPGEPYPSTSAADEFESDAEDTSDFEATEETATDFAGRLQIINRGLDDVLSQLDDIETEWARYERNDQATQLTFLYAQVLALEEVAAELSQAYSNVLNQIDGQDEALLSVDPLPQLLAEIDAKLEQIARRIAALKEEAAGIVIDDEDVLELLRGLIGSGDPALGLRWGLLDSDNDGVSDVDEIALGLDPLINNSDGFIELLDPPDGEEVDYPDTAEIDFEFEELDTDIVESYNLVLQSGGIVWQRRGIDPLETVDLGVLLIDNGPFSGQVANGGLDLQWFVTADIEQSQLFQQIAAANPGFASGFGSTISSEVRDLRINLPVQADVVVLDLESAGPFSVQVGGTVLIRGVLSEVSAMSEWEIELVYDNSMLEYQGSRRLGLFAGSTVFFGDEPGGVLAISGTAPRLSGGISGEGDLFEIEFTALEEGSTTIEVGRLLLTDITGFPIDSEAGLDVELDIR